MNGQTKTTQTSQNDSVISLASVIPSRMTGIAVSDLHHQDLHSQRREPPSCQVVGMYSISKYKPTIWHKDLLGFLDGVEISALQIYHILSIKEHQR